MGFVRSRFLLICAICLKQILLGKEQVSRPIAFADWIVWPTIRRPFLCSFDRLPPIGRFRSCRALFKPPMETISALLPAV